MTDTKISAEEIALIETALSKDDPKLLVAVLNKGIDVNLDLAMRINGEHVSGTLLYIAAFGRKRKIMEALVMLGANVNIGGPMQMTPLMEIASRGNDVVGLKYLIANKADVDAINYFGRTALDFAMGSLKGKKDVIEALLTGSAYIHRGDILDDPPVSMANPRYYKKLQTIVDAFIERKAKRYFKKIQTVIDTFNERKAKAEEELLSNNDLEFEIEIEKEDRNKDLISRMKSWFKKDKKKSSETSSHKPPKR